MKKNLIVVSLLPLLLIYSLFIGCSDEIVSSDNKLEKQLLLIPVKKISELHSITNYENYVKIPRSSSKSNADQYYEEFLYEDINSYFSNNTNDYVIDAVTIYSKNDIVEGLGFYCYDSIDKKLLYYLMRIENSELIPVENFPMVTNRVENKDVVYISDKYFDYANTSLIYSSNTLDDYDLEKNYNDLGLSRTISILEIMNNPNTSEEEFYGEVVKGNGCGFTFTCKDGNPGEMCIPSGCIGPCVVDDFIIELSANPSASDNNILNESILDSNKIHNLQDFLLTTSFGVIYNDIYYRVNYHFYESLDANIVLSIINLAADISEVIDRINDITYNDIIYTDSFVSEISQLLTMSKNNSSSNEYKNSIPVLISELEKYQNMTKLEFINKLNNE